MGMKDQDPPGLPHASRDGSCDIPAQEADKPVHRAIASAFVLGFHPASITGGAMLPLAFTVAGVALMAGCVHLLRSRRREDEQARSGRSRHAREVDALVQQQGRRIKEALQRVMDRDRDIVDHDFQQGFDALSLTVREETGRLEERLERLERREIQRVGSVRSRLDDALSDLRRAGQASVRFVIENSGLVLALEHLRWTMEATGRVQVALRSRGMGRELGQGEQTSIYRLVHDAVDALLGYEGVDRMAIRLERSQGKCLLCVETNGGEALPGHRASVDGRDRLVRRVADLRGSIREEVFPSRGHLLSVEVPLEH